MSNITYRANLDAKSFPLLSELHGRTIIVRGQDQTYIPQVTPQGEADKAVGIPQIYYAHNVLPTSNGYQSIGYQQFATAGGSGLFTQMHILRTAATGEVAHMGVSADGNLYLRKFGSAVWTIVTFDGGNAVLTSAAVTAGKEVTVAMVEGVSYIYFSGVGCGIINIATANMTDQALVGLTLADVLGVAGLAGYLLAYTATSILWSSTIDPTDFVPSLTTGAGGFAVEGIRGDITTVTTVYNGLIVFAQSNAVAAMYSSNPRYPFNFVEISGCGGLISSDYVATNVDSNSVYAYTTSGLQQVTLKSATVVFPEITDFLSGAKFEDFDETMLIFINSAASQSIQKRIATVTSRYVIISYGLVSLTHAIVIDTALKQIGKLKIDHVDCFQFQLYDQSIYETPKKSIGFLKQDGSIYILNSDIDFEESSGVILLGKYQYVRSRKLNLQSVIVENVPEDTTFNLYDMPCQDGKQFTGALAGTVTTDSIGRLGKEYKFNNSATNHSVLGIGRFNLNSLILEFFPLGAR